MQNKTHIYLRQYVQINIYLTVIYSKLYKKLLESIDISATNVTSVKKSEILSNF